MYRLRKEFRFEASHQLMHHDGKCARLHGHSWRGFVEVEGRALVENGPKENMLIDYSDIKAVTKDIETTLDHQHLNDVLNTQMPTSEFVAQWIHKLYTGKFQNGVRLKRVIIEETCTSRCEYDPLA